MPLFQCKQNKTQLMRKPRGFRGYPRGLRPAGKRVQDLAPKPERVLCDERSGLSVNAVSARGMKARLLLRKITYLTRFPEK